MAELLKGKEVVAAMKERLLQQVNKLEEAGARDCLVTVRGVGYKFVLPEKGNEND